MKAQAPMTTLSQEHSAVVNAHTMYRKNVHNIATYKHKVLKPSTNKKLGKRVTKGRYAGFPMYTLTLEERATCPSACEHWADCYGNNMPFGHRFEIEGLMPRLVGTASCPGRFLLRVLCRILGGTTERAPSPGGIWLQ